MVFKHNTGMVRKTFRLGDPVYDNGQLLGGEGLRHTPRPYVPQYELEIVHENSTGRVVEVFDTKTDQCYYMSHKWTCPDKRAFRIVGKAISLGEAQALLRPREMAKAYAEKQTA